MGSAEMWCFPLNGTAQSFPQTPLLSELALNPLAAIFFAKMFLTKSITYILFGFCFYFFDAVFFFFFS